MNLILVFVYIFTENLIIYKVTLNAKADFLFLKFYIYYGYLLL